MKTTLKIALATAALFTGSAMAAGPEVVASVASAGKGRSVIALDMVVPAGVEGIDFMVVVPGLDAKSADLSRATSGLPKGWSGQCSAVKDRVACIATADKPGNALPAGFTSFGKVVVSSKTSTKRGGAAIEVVNVQVSDGAGKSSSGTGKALVD